MSELPPRALPSGHLQAGRIRPASGGRRPQQRAVRRHEALLDAAAALLGEGGFAAVTHRAVAQRAGLPLAATSYYFSSRDALLTEAFALLVERELAQMRASMEAITAVSPDAIADLLAGAYAFDRPRQLGLWELYLQAGRDPALQGIARAWTDGCDEIVATVLRRAGYPHGQPEVRFVTTLLSGLWLEDVVEARPEARGRARDAVARALAAIGPRVEP
ncbi:TetR/AcrR family transcriptional regulator [Microbispora sp. NPDC049125]|uniref:TetR/AcrR family transcriptional regulator n=1 Tax=Microbispora sp. NPDC049125 TaxID=3154929 RepID=UPI003467152F